LIARKANKSIPTLEPGHLVNLMSGSKDCPGIQVDAPRIWKWWREVLVIADLTTLDEVIQFPFTFNA
jgi:hypothetical protein